MRLSVVVLALALLFCLTMPALAEAPVPGAGQGAYLYGTPPRYQIFFAPKPYGGLLMVDTKTGVSWQRIIVNSAKGVEIRWLKLRQVESVPQNESILWN